jgi:hypothetical protein
LQGFLRFIRVIIRLNLTAKWLKWCAYPWVVRPTLRPTTSPEQRIKYRADSHGKGKTTMTDLFKLAKAVADGTLDLICTEMQLLRCPRNEESLLNGTGVIRSDERGRLSFQMVSPVNGIPAIARRTERPHGELYELNEHVLLRALDSAGREWRSNPFIPNVTHAFGSTNWLVSQPVESLGCSLQRPSSSQSIGRLFIPRQRQLPFDRATFTTSTAGDQTVETIWSSDHHVQTIAEAEVEFRLAESDWLAITATQNTPVMPDWPGLVCQALSFATAKEVRPALAAREFSEHIYVHILSGPFGVPASHLPRPLMDISPSSTEDFWQIVQRFVEWARANESRAPALFDELSGIRNVAAASIQTACLGLAVGVESIAEALLNDPVSRAPEESGHIESLISLINAWDGDRGVQQRVVNMLRSMSRTRAVDRLYAFSERAEIPESLVRSWKKLRDMKAHGRTTEDRQSLYDLYYSTAELLYRLVGAVIGYTERVTPTSRRGWEMDQWGFPTSSTTT